MAVGNPVADVKRTLIKLPRMHNSNLQTLQSLQEDELTELVIIPLLQKLGFDDIDYTHGVLERGKDIVFTRRDPLSDPKYIGATVKAHKLDGNVQSSRSMSAVYYQVRQAIDSPFVIPRNGRRVILSEIYVITSHPISQQAIQSISASLVRDGSRVTFIDGSKLLSLVEKHLPDILKSIETSEQRYLHQLSVRFRSIGPLGGLGEKAQFGPHDLYLAPILVPVSVGEARLISFASPNHSFSNGLMACEALNGNAVVIADVGSGKTSLMQRFVIDASENEALKHSDSPVPIFVALSEVPLTNIASGEEFTLFLEEIASMHLGLEKSEAKWFLLDGFDELQGGHDQVSAGIASLVERSDTRVLITSRPSRIPVVEGAGYFRLLPFTPGQICQFLKMWFSDEAQAEEIYAQIEANSDLLAMCRTPLILTLQAILASQSIDGAGISSELPTRRTDIYARSIDMLLGYWDRSRGVVNYYSAGIKWQVLERCAYKCHVERKRRISLRDFKIACFEVLQKSKRVKDIVDNDATQLLRELVYRSSLVRICDNEEIEFVHLSFQEFFAAKMLQQQVFEGAAILKLMRDPWWLNALSFYFGTIRSLDGIMRLPQHGKLKRDGLGLVFLAVLAEADATSLDLQDEIMELVGRDLLSASVNSETLDLCKRLGDRVVSALDHIMQTNFKRKRGASRTTEYEVSQWSGNVFTVLSAINSEKARQVLASFCSKVSPSLSFEGTMSFMTYSLRYITDATFARMVGVLYENVAKLIPGVYDADWNMRYKSLANVVLLTVDAIGEICEQNGNLSSFRHQGKCLALTRKVIAKVDRSFGEAIFRLERDLPSVAAEPLGLQTNPRQLAKQRKLADLIAEQQCWKNYQSRCSDLRL